MFVKMTRELVKASTYRCKEMDALRSDWELQERKRASLRSFVRKEGWAIHLDTMSIAARQRKYEEAMSRLAHATSDNSTRRSKSQVRLVALTRREPTLRSALHAAKARLAAQQRTNMLRLVADSHCRKSNESRQRRARDEELVWEGEQLVARRSANLAVNVVSLIRKQKFEVTKSLNRCRTVVNAASIEFHEADKNLDDLKEEKKKDEEEGKSEVDNDEGNHDPDMSLYESLRKLLERSRATVIRLKDEQDRLDGVSMKAAQSALRDARSTVEQLRKEEEAREIEEELLQAELTALVVLDRKATKKRAAIAELLSRHRASVIRLESALERGQKQQAERLRRFKRRISAREKRISQSRPRLNAMKDRFVTLRRRRILAEEQLEAQRSTGTLQSLIFGNIKDDVRMTTHQCSARDMQTEMKMLEDAMKQRTSNWQELQQHREENLVLLRAILSSYERDRESMEVDMRGVAITGVLSSSDSRLRDDAKQLHRRICVLHQGLVSLQIAATKWQTTYDKEEKDAIEELVILQAEADQREVEREEIELEGLALRGERELARKKKEMQREKVRDLNDTVKRLELELQKRTSELCAKNSEHEHREEKRRDREKKSNALNVEMVTRRPIVSHLLWRATSREKTQRESPMRHLVVYPSETFRIKIMAVRDEALKSFQKELRRESNAKNDFNVAQECKKRIAKLGEMSYEAMIELQKALHTMSRIRVDYVDVSKSISHNDDNGMNEIVGKLRSKSEAMMPALEREYDALKSFTLRIESEIKDTKEELSCMKTRRCETRAVESRDLNAAVDIVKSEAQFSKLKREMIAKIMSSASLKIQEFETCQNLREQAWRVKKKWIQKLKIAVTSMQKKSKMRFQFLETLRKHVQERIISVEENIGEQVNVLLSLSRKMNSEHKNILDERSNVEDWIASVNLEISSDTSELRELISSLREIQIEPMECELSDMDSEVLKKNEEYRLGALILSEQHKLFLNRLRKYEQDLERLNSTYNAIRVTNAKEMSSLRVISTFLLSDSGERNK